MTARIVNRKIQRTASFAIRKNIANKTTPAIMKMVVKLMRQLAKPGTLKP
jgi:hypothetical protein